MDQVRPAQGADAETGLRRRRRGLGVGDGRGERRRLELADGHEARSAPAVYQVEDLLRGQAERLQGIAWTGFDRVRSCGRSDGRCLLSFSAASNGKSVRVGYIRIRLAT